MTHRFLTVLYLIIFAAAVAGCANRVSFIDKGSETGEQRWKVDKLKSSKLTTDQRAVLSSRGKPDFIKFYHPMKKRGGGLIAKSLQYIGKGLKAVFIYSVRPVDSYQNIQAWVYEKSGTLVWFKDGKNTN